MQSCLHPQPFEFRFFDEEEEEEEERTQINGKKNPKEVSSKQYMDDESDEDCGTQTDDIIALARALHGLQEHDDDRVKKAKKNRSSLKQMLGLQWRRFCRAFCLYGMETGLYLLFLAGFLFLGTGGLLAAPGAAGEEEEQSWGILEIVAVALIFAQTTYLGAKEVEKQFGSSNDTSSAEALLML